MMKSLSQPASHSSSFHLNLTMRSASVSVVYRSDHVQSYKFGMLQRVLPKSASGDKIPNYYVRHIQVIKCTAMSSVFTCTANINKATQG